MFIDESGKLWDKFQSNWSHGTRVVSNLVQLVISGQFALCDLLHIDGKLKRKSVELQSFR